MKYQLKLWLILVVMLAISVLLSIYLLGFFSLEVRGVMFPVFAFLGLIFCVSGITLILCARKERGALKYFLLLTGLGAIMPLIGILLHNLFYGLSVELGRYQNIFGTFDNAFYILALFVAPGLFICGLIGSIILLWKKIKT